MDANSWEHILHELGIIIAALAAAIAATSSLKNGRILKNGANHGTPKVSRRQAKKKTLKGEPGEEGQDWYSPPELK